MKQNAKIAPSPARRRTTLVASLLTVCSLTCPSLAQATWSPVPQSTPPVARQSARMMAYDQVNDRIVLFGGSPASGTYLGDTRVFACGTGTWSQVVSAQAPAPRYGHSLTYDAARNEVILFGGRLTNANGALDNQTWAFNGTTWQQRSPQNAPTARFLHATVYDSMRSVIVLFGGGSAAVTSDTWEWDGVNWTQRATTIPSPNPLRSNSAIAYDPVRQRTVIFGGRTTSTFFGGTLEWDGTAWTNVTPAVGPNPPNRAAAAMTYHAGMHRVVMHNGNTATNNLNDTWYWDGTAWTEVFPGTPPAQRGNSGMVYDSLRDRLVLFGGNGPTQHHNDLWSFASATPARLQSFGQGCGGTVPVPVLTPADHRRPWLGDTYAVAVNGLPSGGLVVMATGLSAPPVPFPLGGVGMPGCSGLVSPDLLQAMLHAGSAAFAFAVPNQPALAGLSLYHQALVFHPGVNPFGAVTSDGMQAVLGLR
jgi:Galactose oxidase, central domain